MQIPSVRYSRPWGVSTVWVAKLAIFLIYHRLVGPRVISISTCCQQGGAHGGSGNIWKLGCGRFWLVLESHLENVWNDCRFDSPHFFRSKHISRTTPQHSVYLCCQWFRGDHFPRLRKCAHEILYKNAKFKFHPKWIQTEWWTFFSCAETIGLRPATGFTFHIWIPNIPHRFTFLVCFLVGFLPDC